MKYIQIYLLILRMMVLEQLLRGNMNIAIVRGSRPQVFLRKSVLKICSTFTGEHTCRSVISIKLQNKRFVKFSRKSHFLKSGLNVIFHI